MVEEPMKKIKVLLTNATGIMPEEFNKDYNKRRGYSLYPPLSLTTVAASIFKKVDDIEVEVLDMNFETIKYFNENDKSDLSTYDFMKNKIVDKMDEFQPDLVGISVLFSPAHSNALAMANIVKEKNSTTQVVCGGVHTTFAYKRMLEECPNIDFIFLYEADNTFPLFLEYLKGKVKFEDLKGIAWLDKNTNEPKLAPHAPLIHELDKLPIPEWDLVPLKKYSDYGRVGAVHMFGDTRKPTYMMQTVRGCVAQCTFCSVRSFYGKGVRSYSPKRVLEEIDYLYNELGIRQLDIMDDDFTYDRERTLEICNGLVKRNYNLIWNLSNGIRLGTINDEIMDALIKAKCRNITIGVESGNDSTLALVRKPVSIKMLYRKSEIFKRYPELYVKANYMVGFPFENDEQMMNTFRLAEDLDYDWHGFTIFQPLPGTPEFQKLDQKSQDNFDFDSIAFNHIHLDARKKYEKEIEKQMQDAMMDQNSKEPSRNQKNKKISHLAYSKSLEINFLKNKNLTGVTIDKYVENNKRKYQSKIEKPQNIDRAIRDFEAILQFHDNTHAIAHYCLAKAYRHKDDVKLVKHHMSKVSSILANPQHNKWIGHFDNLVPKNEMNELKTFSSKNAVQIQSPV
jgi:anaerobic magnesium-protoporphyrin IX monomethyl ester cyclase